MASDFGDMADRVSDLSDELKRQHRRATSEAMDDLQTGVVTELRNNDSVARRQLVGDVRHTRYPTTLLIGRSVNVPLWARFLEHGTGSRGRTDPQPDHETYPAPSPLPPIEPIETWVIAKNITSNTYDDPNDLATAIQRTIGEIGTFPHPFLRPAWYGVDGYQHIIDENVRAIRRALRRL